MPKNGADENHTNSQSDQQPDTDNPDTTEDTAELDDAEANDPLLRVSNNNPSIDDMPKPRISAVPTGKHTPQANSNWFKRFITTKKLSIPVGVALLLGVLVLVPVTRYAIAGLVVKQSFRVAVVDSETKKPITSALVELAGTKVETDNKGQATLKVPIGSAKLAVSKKYYASTSLSVTVPLLKQKDIPKVLLRATGRQIPLTLTNVISKKPVANITVSAGGSEATTDAKGQAILVVPAAQKQVEVTFTGRGYNTKTQTVAVGVQYIKVPEYTVTPEGKVYFLSNASGKLDVVKTNLDGSDRQTVVAGTGKEDKFGTSLLASRDWKYLVLQAKRDSDQPKLYLVDTSSDKLTTIDEGEATFGLQGWSGHHLIYTVNRYNVNENDAKHFAVKSFNAETLKLTTLAENEAAVKSAIIGGGSITEQFSQVYIFDKEVVYARYWDARPGYNSWGARYPTDYGAYSGKQATLNTVQPDGSSKKVVKAYDHIGAVDGIPLSLRAYAPQEVYMLYTSKDGKSAIDEYQDGHVKLAASQNTDDFYNDTYPTYLVSPSGNQTFWTNYRDGKQMFSLGNKQGDDEKQIATLDKYNTYGWYTDDYLLFSKDKSELYIAPAAELTDESALLKVSNYYRPGTSYEGYGYGYGGL